MAAGPDTTTDAELPDGVRGELLVDGRRYGERFVAYAGTPTGPGWVAPDDLFGSGLPDALGAVAEARGTTSTAVAATLLLESYAQRVVAPVLAALYLEGGSVDAGLDSVRVEPSGAGFRRPAFAQHPRPVAPGPEARRRVSRRLLDDHLDVVVDALHRHSRAGTRVLRGAIAHAVAITFLHLSWPGPDRARFVEPAREFLDEVPGLRGLVGIETVAEAGEPWMYTDRNTCCLAFRTTVNQERDQPYCATCPVLGRDRTRALFGQATTSYLQRHG